MEPTPADKALKESYPADDGDSTSFREKVVYNERQSGFWAFKNFDEKPNQKHC